jgi:hypothetical protein
MEMHVITKSYRYRWNTVISELNKNDNFTSEITIFIFTLAIFSTIFRAGTIFLEYYMEWCPFPLFHWQIVSFIYDKGNFF